MKNKLLTLALVAGLAVSSLSVSMAASSTVNVRSESGGGGSAPSSTAGTTGAKGATGAVSTTTNASGEQVATTVTTANGVTMKSMKIGSAGTTVNQASQTVNGATVTIRQTTNAPATANGVAVCNKAILIISQNGVTSGCFVDETTGRPLATGKDEVYMAYDENGNLVAHYVNAFGMFYTGVQVLNGVQHTFNSEGVLIA